jgi:hypothetical protein
MILGVCLTTLFWLGVAQKLSCVYTWFVPVRTCLKVKPLHTATFLNESHEKPTPHPRWVFHFTELVVVADLL